ncbi:MAG: TonB-dependent receptor [Bacteroidota bacterium]|nr:TonB-dependent receptor [Bacteroidota bacterium]
MLKKLLKAFTHYFVVCIIFPQFSKANVIETGQVVLHGKVIDAQTQHPLSGATVSIPDLKLGVITDSKGDYEIKGLPTGVFLVEVKFVGYATATKNVAFKDNVIANFSLQESATEIGEVVVTGTSKATQIKRSPVPIVTVNHSYLLSNSATNAIDAIAKIPGVRTVTTGPNVSKPIIRGLGYNRILTLYDGVRQEGQQWGDEHGIEVDQFSIDRVEVIKGPASLSYGSDALAGVVNLIPTQPAPEGKMIGEVLLNYQTNNKFIGGSGMLGATKNGFEWMARISHKQAVDYQNKVDGRVFGTAFRETDANASLGLHRKWGYSHLNFVLFDDLQEIPDGSRDSATWKFTRQITEIDTVRQIVSNHDLNSYAIEKLHQHVQHARIYWSNNFILGESRLDVNFGFQNSRRREYSHPELFTIPGLDLQLQTYTYDLKYHFPSLNNWDVTAGVNGMYQNNTVTNGTEFVIPNYHQFDIGGFVLGKKTFGKLDIAGGARLDGRNFNNQELYTDANPVTGFDMPVTGSDTIGAQKIFSAYKHNFSGFSGSIGATYNFSEKFSVKVNLARGYRAPNIAELSANGVHPGTNIYQIGSDQLKPEFSLQQDVGFVFSSKYAVIQLSVFNNTIDNYIYNQKLLGANGQDSVLVPGNQIFKFVATKANLWGGEFSVDLHPIKPLHFENSVSVVNAINKGNSGIAVADSEKYLPFIPPVHGTSELRYNFNLPKSGIKNAFVKVQLEYYASQNNVFSAYGTETPTPGYSLFNAGFGGSITNKKGDILFNVYVMGNNLFNLAYWDHLSRLKYFYGNYQNPGPNDNPREHGIYNMGRNVSLKIDFPLNYTLKKKN